MRTATGCLFELIETVVLTVVIFLVIQTLVAQPYKVEQHSMETTLLPDQYVLVDKLTPRFSEYSRGDVIVFEPPAAYRGDGTPFIKRVIGLPGERIDVKNGKVYVNGVALDEPYVPAGEPTEASGSASSWKIGAGELFVLGDNRENSSDSRVFGPIQRDSVIGRAWLRYWPLNAFGVLAHPTYPQLAGILPAAEETAATRPAFSAVGATPI